MIAFGLGFLVGFAAACLVGFALLARSWCVDADHTDRLIQAEVDRRIADRFERVENIELSTGPYDVVHWMPGAPLFLDREGLNEQQP